MSKKILLSLFLGAFILSACDCDGGKEEAERKRRLEAKIELLNKEAQEGARKAQEAASQEAQTPAEPQYEEKDFFKVEGTECADREESACGITFRHCADGKVYACFHNIKYSVIQKKVQIE